MAMVAVVVVAAGQVVVPGWPAPAGAGSSLDCARIGPVAADEATAVSLAVACGRRVEVATAQSYFTTVFAEPDGRLMFESAVVPQRTRRADGSWTPVDLTLASGLGGLVRPLAPVADVAFSGGGSTPLASLTRAGKSLTLSWPGGLPAPLLSGDEAVYPEVLPGVDLVVRATHTGFSHVLVVKTAAAAANPALRSIRFGVGGDAAVRELPDGSLQATADGTVLASAGAPVMWDSTNSPVGGEGSRFEASSAVAAGDFARFAPVGVAVTGDGQLELTPDLEMLTGQGTAFPVYIDPSWDAVKNKWAYATNTGCTNTDTTRARVGLSPEGPCPGDLFRSFFRFSTSDGGVSLSGKYIHSAYVSMKLYHSWSCTDTWISMWKGATINATPRATWSKMTLSTFLDSAPGHAHKPSGGAGCAGDPQADMIMNFNSNAVRDLVRSAAAGAWSSITVGFSARSSDGTGESTQNRWKKFYPNNAKLIVTYDSKPGTPKGLQVAGVACGSGVLTIGTLSPRFSAVYPDADSGQTLSGAYEWIEVPAGGMGSVTATSPARKTPPPAAPATAGGRGTTAAVTIAAGKTYAFRVRATDPAPYSQTSAWSAWCQFVPDTTVPAAPTVTPGAIGGPGQPVTFTFSIPQDGGSQIAKFRYGWTSPPTTEVAATGTTTKAATVTVTLTKYGQNTLWVRAIDATGNLGNLASREVTVARPSPPIARWGLETYPGVTQTQALTDAQPSLGGNTPVTATGVAWQSDLRLVGGKSAAFNGSSAQAVTAGPVVDTTKSYSVAAWVRLTAVPTSHMKVASQEAADAAGFEFGIRPQGDPSVPYWSFLMKDTTAQSSSTRMAIAPAAITSADVGRWTHLAGVYDKPAGKLRLYLNGLMVAETDRAATPWAATGRFAVGRGFASGAATNWFNGAIADVQVFDRALVDHDFTGQLASDPESGGVDEPGILAPIRVGDWTFEGMVPCWEPLIAPGVCEAREVGPFSRRLALAQGSNVAAGQRGDGLDLNGYWDLDEFDPRYHTLATDEYGWSQTNTGAPEAPSWQDGPMARTDQSITVSAWVKVDTDVAASQAVWSLCGVHECALWLKYHSTTGVWRAVLMDEDVSGSPFATTDSVSQVVDDEWTHLVVSYDAGADRLRLYVNGVLESTRQVSYRAFNAAGPLYLGRTTYRSNVIDHLSGTVDDANVFQGAMTDAQAKQLYDEQLVEDLQP